MTTRLIFTLLFVTLALSARAQPRFQAEIDPTFQSEITNVTVIAVDHKNRVYVQLPDDSRRIARLHENGELDRTFSAVDSKWMENVHVALDNTLWGRVLISSPVNNIS
jgi:hypothetical protein